MPQTIHLVRHAQGYHNLNSDNHRLHDPELTELGKQQCADLRASFPTKESVDLIVASPLRRTIYTALLSFADVLEKDQSMRLVTLPELQETSDLPCDTGSNLETLLKEFEGKPVDLNRVVEGWNSKRGYWAPTAQAVTERAKAARQWLRDRKENEIVVVAHGALLHFLSNDWHGATNFQGTGWRNCEVRTYNFDPKSGDEAYLFETSASRERRRGAEKPLGEAEQRNLMQLVVKDWVTVGELKEMEAES
ncbi:phosphoglycerate mutase family protein-like protein [Patellaria atrata CBS 101060]|uniref:Phosphoglycerate mutase family protein-like protein n=1 Tax=Patellaria atrata CBS 101060 TaxID=1346257 RepID=A0A9P4VRJ3_9PEZI|nr:phosphoglycerate mutase family protein-like protein [Patellaria atrata CBS 101060]